MMKRFFMICAVMIAVIMFAIPVCATDISTEVVTEVTTEAATDVVTEVTTELEAVIDENASLSEVILAIANEFGLSVGEAEQLVKNIKTVGDKYFGESDLWAMIVEDMNHNPAKWTLTGLVFLLVIALVAVLIKRVLSDAITAQRMKIAIENLDKALNGDEKDENGRAVSIRAMIGEKNGQIETLEKQNKAQREHIAELKGKAEELTGVINALQSAIGKIESNSDTSLKITEEAALQIMQLINIALDRNVPITSKEARQIWYEHTQSKIKSIYEEGQTDGEAGETGSAV